MQKKQLILIYALVIFMMTWGFDIINIIKYNKNFHWEERLNLFSLSQVLYAGGTLVLTRLVFRRYFISRQYIKLMAGILALLAFFILLRYSIEELFYPWAFHINNYADGTSFSYFILDNIYYSFIYVLLGVFIFLLDNEVRNRQHKLLMLQQQQEAELKFLRSQINPHFLFNSLNNIYALIYQRSDKALESVQKLSELLRYTLYEENETVPLTKEWHYLCNYIDLQKLRYDFELALEIKENIEYPSAQIAPLLLIPFVENAFKHGEFKEPAHPLLITLKSSTNALQFEVSNKKSKQQKDHGKGVGLENVQKRLELLYPGKHRFTISETEHEYKISLQVALNG